MLGLFLALPLYAQDASKILTPHPITIVLVTGKWLMKDSEPQYYLRVRSSGATEADARQSAFSLAVEQAIGSVVATEAESQNQRLTRNEIVSYSSGYVDDFKIINKGYNGHLVEIEVDVWVRRSRIANRLLNNSQKIDVVEGEKMAAQYDSLMEERSRGDRLIQTVLNDYPKRAFKFEPMPAKTRLDDNRNIELELAFKLRWNQDYLESLREAMSLVAQHKNANHCIGNWAEKCSYVYYVTFKYRPGANGWSRTPAFDDYTKARIIHGAIFESKPAVLVVIKNPAGSIVHRACYRWSQLDNQGYSNSENLMFPTSNGLQFNGYVTLDARLPIKLGKNSNILSEFDRVEYEVVRASSCPN